MCMVKSFKPYFITTFKTIVMTATNVTIPPNTNACVVFCFFIFYLIML